MTDNLSLYVVKTSRNGYLERLTIINDRDKRAYPLVLAYETKNKAVALKFDSDIVAQAVADLLIESKEESFYIGAHTARDIITKKEACSWLAS